MLNECNGCEYKCSLSHIDICTLGSPCPHQKPLTNEVWFCSLPTEEKATFLAIQIRLGVEFYRTNDERYQNHDWWVRWLKQPYIPLKNDEK
jgi:hypothetical protein